MAKVEEAQAILKALGLPKAQQNEISALTLLALCNIREDGRWADATRQSMRISNDIMAFVNAHYKRDRIYAPNTRETFRRRVLHQFEQARIADRNPDIPDLPVNSPRVHYKLTDEAQQVIKSYGTAGWAAKVAAFAVSAGKLREKYDRVRNLHKIPVTIEGKKYELSAGKHNEVQVAVINEFASRFIIGPKVLYMGDTAKKDMYVDAELLKSTGIPVTEHGKLPDIIILDEKMDWLFLIEVVTSHGPTSPKRVLELEDMLKNCKSGKVYVTAFPDKNEFKKHMADVAWETEVWIADNPDHMIHFNGDRFIGPR
jgi:hypothetical protein